jgi:hypothetical protein
MPRPRGDNKETNVVNRWALRMNFHPTGIIGGISIGGARNPTPTAQALGWRTANIWRSRKRVANGDRRECWARWWGAQTSSSSTQFHSEHWVKASPLLYPRLPLALFLASP